MLRNNQLSTSSSTSNSTPSTFSSAGNSTPSTSSSLGTSASSAGQDLYIYSIGAVVALAVGVLVLFAYNHRSSQTLNKERV